MKYILIAFLGISGCAYVPSIAKHRQVTEINNKELDRISFRSKINADELARLEAHKRQCDNNWRKLEEYKQYRDEMQTYAQEERVDLYRKLYSLDGIIEKHSAEIAALQGLDDHLDMRLDGQESDIEKLQALIEAYDKELEEEPKNYRQWTQKIDQTLSSFREEIQSISDNLARVSKEQDGYKGLTDKKMFVEQMHKFAMSNPIEFLEMFDVSYDELANAILDKYTDEEEDEEENEPVVNKTEVGWKIRTLKDPASEIDVPRIATLLSLDGKVELHINNKLSGTIGGMVCASGRQIANVSTYRQWLSGI